MSRRSSRSHLRAPMALSSGSSSSSSGGTASGAMPVLLPEDQFHHICSFLDVSSVLMVATTCWQLNAWCRLCKTVDVEGDVATASVRRLLRLFPDVTDLTLRRAAGMDAAGYAALGAVGSQLSRLRLRRARVIANEPLLSLAGSADLSTLLSLELSGTFFARGDAAARAAAAAPNLTSLTLTGFRHLRDADVAAVAAALPQLETLCVSDCTGLAHVRVGPAPALRALSLARCVHVATVSLDAPSLTLLDCSTCTKLRDGALDAMLAACPRLHHAVLRGCAGLGALRIESHSLLTLDLSCSGSLEAVELCCPRLVRLSLDMCMSLVSASLRLASIESLDLSLLPVESLALDCVALHALNLRGTYRLHDSGIRVHAPALEVVDHCSTHISPAVFGGVRSVFHGGMLLQWISG